MKAKLPAIFTQNNFKSRPFLQIEFSTKKFRAKTQLFKFAQIHNEVGYFSPNDKQKRHTGRKPDSMTSKRLKPKRLRAVIYKI